MISSIQQNIIHFLQSYSPFDLLSKDDLETLAKSTTIINLEKNDTLFQINDILKDAFYVVYSGTILLSFVSDSEEKIINKCNTGDVFGLRPLFAKNNYQMNSVARESSIILAIPISVFKPIMTSNIEVLDFLLNSYATINKVSYFNNKETSTSKEIQYVDTTDANYFQNLEINKNPIIADKSARIKDIAEQMNAENTNCVLISENKLPIGIVTDTDFRKNIATGRFEIFATIDKIMTSPVFTINDNLNLEEALLLMIKNDITHLCVTADGTDKSEIIGVISQHDLVVAQANNPGILLKQTKNAQNVNDIKNVISKLSEIIQTSLYKNIPLSNIFSISSELTIAIVNRAIEISIKELGSPPTRFGYFLIGSQGRKEQLLISNHNSFLVFEDVSENNYRDVKDYYLKLSKRCVEILENVGYKQPKNNLIASNISYCKSLSEWKTLYANWINTPGENSNKIHSTFFDYELAYGDPKIESDLTALIFDDLKSKTLFFDYFGNETLRNPYPLNFFKKFIVEENGDLKGFFNLKDRAIAPLVDAARLFTLAYNIKGITNTYLRFKQLAIVDKKNAEIYLNSAEAFVTLSRYKVIEGLKNDTNGNFINLDEINKIDKEKIKSALAPMRDMEELIKDKFQLTQFS